MKHGCRQLLMGCHPHRFAWVHHTGAGGGALGVALFIILIACIFDKRRPR